MEAGVVTTSGESTVESESYLKEVTVEVSTDKRRITDVQNGVSRPRGGTKGGRVWEIADMLSEQGDEPIPRGPVMAACKAEGLTHNTIGTQYQRWRDYYELSGNGVSEFEKAAKIAERSAASVKSNEERKKISDAKAFKREAKSKLKVATAKADKAVKIAEKTQDHFDKLAAQADAYMQDVVVADKAADDAEKEAGEAEVEYQRASDVEDEVSKAAIIRDAEKATVAAEKAEEKAKLAAEKAAKFI